MKKRSILPIIFSLLIILVSCIEKETTKEYSLEESKKIAESFVINSLTYSSDGSNLRLIDSNKLRCDNCFIFVFEFTSSHAGFGDRSEKVIAEVVIEHVISVIVQNDEVVQAIIDNRWNEIKQKPITDYETIDLEKSARIPLYYCTEPRPKLCPDENEPTCSSDKKDYRNGCEACTKKTTKWYTKGGCNLGYVDRVIRDLKGGKLTKESGPVLILWGWSVE